VPTRRERRPLNRPRSAWPAAGSRSSSPSAFCIASMRGQLSSSSSPRARRARTTHATAYCAERRASSSARRSASVTVSFRENSSRPASIAARVPESDTISAVSSSRLDCCRVNRPPLLVAVSQGVEAALAPSKSAGEIVASSDPR